MTPKERISIYIVTLLTITAICAVAVFALQQNERQEQLDAVSFGKTGLYFLRAQNQVYPGAMNRVSGVNAQQQFNSISVKAMELALADIAKADTVENQSK